MEQQLDVLRDCLSQDTFKYEKISFVDSRIENLISDIYNFDSEHNFLVDISHEEALTHHLVGHIPSQSTTYADIFDHVRSQINIDDHLEDGQPTEHALLYHEFDNNLYCVLLQETMDIDALKSEMLQFFQALNSAACVVALHEGCIRSFNVIKEEFNTLKANIHPRITFSLVFLPFLGMFLLGCSFSVLNPLLPEQLTTLNAGSFAYSAILSVFALSSTIASPFLGKITDKFGQRLTILVCLFFLSVSLYCSAISKTLIGHFMSRALGGIFASCTVTISSLFSDLTPKNSPAKVHLFGWMTSMMSLSGIFGIFGGAYFYDNVFDKSFEKTMYLFMLFCFVSFIVEFFGLKNHIEPQKKICSTKSRVTGLSRAEFNRFKELEDAVSEKSIKLVDGVPISNISYSMVSYFIKHKRFRYAMLSTFLVWSTNQTILNTVGYDLVTQQNASATLVSYVLLIMAVSMVMFHMFFVKRLSKNIGQYKLALYGQILITIVYSLYNFFDSYISYCVISAFHGIVSFVVGPVMTISADCASGWGALQDRLSLVAFLTHPSIGHMGVVSQLV
ncbi:hypothetical protein PCE1_004638 [Barthelona sp. PCE]